MWEASIDVPTRPAFSASGALREKDDARRFVTTAFSHL
jgi:hypothetical protein